MALLLLLCQIAEPEVAKLCAEAQECIVNGRWLDLASLMVSSAELVSPKVSEKGIFLVFLLDR